MTAEPDADPEAEDQGVTRFPSLRFPSLKDMVELLQEELENERELRQAAEARVRELEGLLGQRSNP